MLFCKGKYPYFLLHRDFTGSDSIVVGWHSFPYFPLYSQGNLVFVFNFPYMFREHYTVRRFTICKEGFPCLCFQDPLVIAMYILFSLSVDFTVLSYIVMFSQQLQIKRSLSAVIGRLGLYGDLFLIFLSWFFFINCAMSSMKIHLIFTVILLNILWKVQNFSMRLINISLHLFTFLL